MGKQTIKMNKNNETNTLDHTVHNNNVIIHPTHFQQIYNLHSITPILESAFTSNDIKTVVIDLKNIRPIDSLVIGNLVKLRNDSQKNGKEFALCNVADEIRMVFETAKLTDFLTILSRDELGI